MLTGRDKNKAMEGKSRGGGGGESHELSFKKRLRQRKYREAEPFA